MSEKKIKLLAAIKAIFNTTPPAAAPTPAPAPAQLEANIVGYSVDGGQPVFTDISNDGVAGLDQNDYVFSDEALTTAYPDGTYKVIGTEFSFTVTGGIITSITDAAGTGPGEAMKPAAQAAAPAPNPAPAQPATPVAMSEMTPEKIEAMFAVTGQSLEEKVAGLQVMVKALMQYSLGYEIARAQQHEAIEAYKTTIEGMEVEMAKHQQFSTQAIELLEQLVEQPTVAPVTLPENKKDGFAKKKEEKLNQFAESVAKMKKEKKIQ